MKLRRLKDIKRRISAMKEIVKISPQKPPFPRILLTMDSKEPKFEAEIKPILEVFVQRRIPMTFFISNETLSGRDNGEEIKKIIDFSGERSLSVEIASHGVSHRDMSSGTPDEIARWISESVFKFRRNDIAVKGFRAPFFSTEFKYKMVIDALDNQGVNLAYDSSISFESNLMTSILQLMVGKKTPHKIGPIWELPISILDDYHILQGGELIKRSAFYYWAVFSILWIHRNNYIMFLFHPHVILKNLKLLNRIIMFLEDKYGNDAFTTCADLVEELEDKCAHFINQ